MTMRSSGDWIDDAPRGDNPVEWLEWIRAIQRDALESACDAIWDRPEDMPLTYRNVRREIRAMIPEEPKP